MAAGRFPVVLGGYQSIGFATTRAVAGISTGTTWGSSVSAATPTSGRPIKRMHATPWFHPTGLPNVPPKNLVQLGIGGW